MMNPVQLVRLMRSGNPQQVIADMLRQNAGSSPILSNAYQLYQNGKYDEIEKLARNLCQEKGIDADEMIRQIKSQFGK